jgi:hypothetical protein
MVPSEVRRTSSVAMTGRGEWEFSRKHLVEEGLSGALHWVLIGLLRNVIFLHNTQDLIRSGCDAVAMPGDYTKSPLVVSEA